MYFLFWYRCVANVLRSLGGCWENNSIVGGGCEGSGARREGNKCVFRVEYVPHYRRWKQKSHSLGPEHLQWERETFYPSDNLFLAWICFTSIFLNQFYSTCSISFLSFHSVHMPLPGCHGKLEVSVNDKAVLFSINCSCVASTADLWFVTATHLSPSHTSPCPAHDSSHFSAAGWLQLTPPL